MRPQTRKMHTGTRYHLVAGGMPEDALDAPLAVIGERMDSGRGRIRQPKKEKDWRRECGWNQGRAFTKTKRVCARVQALPPTVARVVKMLLQHKINIHILMEGAISPAVVWRGALEIARVP